MNSNNGANWKNRVDLKNEANSNNGVGTNGGETLYVVSSVKLAILRL